MLKLYGIALSNYTNMVRTALEEKGMDYELVVAPPSRKEEHLARSPLGKVPCIETEEGFLSETHPILDYLEDLQPEPPLLPAHPFARAKVRELVQVLELYVELVARKGIGSLFGKEVPEHVKAAMKRDLPRGAEAVRQLAKFSPWIAGEHFTYADLVGYYTFSLANILSRAHAEMDLLEMIPGAPEWHARVGERDSVRKADADARKAREAMAGR